MLELQKFRVTACRLLRKRKVHVKRKITLKLCKLHPHEFLNKTIKDKLEDFSQVEVHLFHPNIKTNEPWESDRQDKGGNHKKNDNISNQICLKYM
jgi:hypothetical protein